MNRLFAVTGEGGPAYNRSDGLVKQAFAQIPGAHRTFIHKCHGGNDSLVTSREAYEIATQFFFGNVRAVFDSWRPKSNVAVTGSASEFFFGVAIKPRKVDFDLFYQSLKRRTAMDRFPVTTSRILRSISTGRIPRLDSSGKDFSTPASSRQIRTEAASLTWCCERTSTWASVTPTE